MKILLGYILTFGWVFAVLGVAQAVKTLLHTGDEASRKVVHIGVSLAWIPMYFCFGRSFHLLIPPLVFVVLNYISCKKNIFSMMERSDAEKQSYGTVYYAVSMSVMAGLSLLDGRFLLPYGTGLFCMAFGDGLAPCFGSLKSGNRRLFGSRRTLYGSISVLIVSFAVVALMRVFFSLPLGWGEMAAVAVCAAVMELVGVKGLDNFTLPLGVCLLTWAFTAF